jgi:hypothetical protein
MTPPPLAFDHIALAAATREGGIAFARERLGFEVPLGGAHTRMGTHNAVAGTGDDTYLEILTIDPDAPAPRQPRWFGLDGPDMRAQLAHGPRVAAWVVRTPDIAASLAAARRAGLDLGEPITMTRGELQWTIAYRADGRLLEDGALPVLIQWQDGPHPSRRMSDSGLWLSRITLRHPDPERLGEMLEALGARDLVEIDPQASERPAIAVSYEGPDGLRHIP